MAAVGGQIRGRAQADVERIVDAAETEAARRLRGELHVVAGTEGQDDARRKAVRAHRTRLVRVALVGEDAGEGEQSILAEIVVAQAGGQRPLRTEAVGCLAEHRELLEVITQARIERRIRRRVEIRAVPVDHRRVMAS